MFLSIRFARLGFVLGAGVFCIGVAGAGAQQQDVKAQQIVRTAAEVEMQADRDDHSLWQYRDVDRKPGGGETVAKVIETEDGGLNKRIKIDGRPLSSEELQQEDARVAAFVLDKAAQEKQRRDGEQDDKRAQNMLRMLPDAFVWTVKSDDGRLVTLGYVPNPAFHAPTMESRVFAAMAGEICVDKAQNRIRTIKGQLVEDVKFGFGLFGKMNKGGTFDVERREITPGIWVITESHVHIDGKALLFKTIGEQDDEVKSEFRRVAPRTTLEQAALMLKGEPPSLSARQIGYLQGALQ